MDLSKITCIFATKAKRVMKYDAKKIVLEVCKGLSAAIIVGLLIMLPFWAANRKADKVRGEFREKIDSLEEVINRMQGVDTLVLDASMLNTYNINKVSRDQTELSKRISIVQQKVYDIDAELNSYD